MTKPNIYLWPARVRFDCFTARGKRLWHSKDRNMEMTESLMDYGLRRNRTLLLDVHTLDPRWEIWDEKRVRWAEWRIRYDLDYDNYYVSFTRQSDVGVTPCSSPFRWKVTIRRKPRERWI